MFVSNLVPLPTLGNADTFQLFQEQILNMDTAIQALGGHVNDNKAADSRVAAADARNFLQITREALLVIGAQTAFCDPEALASLGCEFVQHDDEGGASDPIVAFSDGGGTFDIIEEFAREVRSPFFYGIPQLGPQEDIIIPEPLAAGDCVPIVKETRGVKVVVRPVNIPMWVEPWFARAAIVGVETVWVWEFVPAEFVKTISYCNDAGTITQAIDMELIRDRPMMHLWKFFAKDP